jgi:pimeloyl-ACP methyl ester carboxylesterase
MTPPDAPFADLHSDGLPAARSGPAGRSAGGLAYDDDGSGEPILLVHAGVADRRMWAEPASELSRGRRVLRHDVRGVGESMPPTGAWSHHTDLLALLDELLIPSAHLVGASMGAGIAAEAALARPEAVASLVLVAPGGALLGDAPAALRPIWGAEIDALDRGDLDGAVEVNLRAWVDGPRRGPEAVDPDLRASVGRMQREAFELPEWDPELAPEHELSPPAWSRLGELACPVLVLVGDGDQPVILETAERIAREAPRARLVVWPDVGHMLSLERPGDFMSLVAGFLDAVRDGRFDGQPTEAPASTAASPDTTAVDASESNEPRAGRA